MGSAGTLSRMVRRAMVLGALVVCGCGSRGSQLEQQKAACTNALALRRAAQLYQTMHGGACPTLDMLVSEGVIDGAVSDPWGQPYKIACSGKTLAVASSGADKTDGTADDVTAPACDK